MGTMKSGCSALDQDPRQKDTNASLPIVEAPANLTHGCGRTKGAGPYALISGEAVPLDPVSVFLPTDSGKA